GRSSVASIMPGRSRLRISAIASYVRFHSVKSAAPSATKRPWRPRGVPTPKSVRIQSPRLKAPACTSTAATASSCSAASGSVCWIVVVSPWSALYTVTPTSAPVSRSMACSALWARCVRPFFIFVILASGSCGWVHRHSSPSFCVSDRSAPSRPAWASNTRGLRQRGQKLFVALAAVAPHDAAQTCVGFERRRVNADRLPLHQPGRCEALQDPGEDRSVRFEVDQPTRTRNRRVIRRGVLQTDAQKVAQRERVRGAPGDAALGIDPLEIANQQEPEVNA